MDLTNEEAERLHGQDVRGLDDDKVGSVEDLYVDAQTGAAEWVLVNRGFLGMAHSVVPLVGATFDDGIRVIFTADAVKNAPDVDADEAISEEDERRLYAHYRENMPDVDGVLVVETYDIGRVRRPADLRRTRRT